MPTKGASDATTGAAAFPDFAGGRAPTAPVALRRRIRGACFRAAINPEDAPRRLETATVYPVLVDAKSGGRLAHHFEAGSTDRGFAQRRNSRPVATFEAGF